MTEAENEEIARGDGFENVEGDGDLVERLLRDGFGRGVVEDCPELHRSRRGLEVVEGSGADELVGTIADEGENYEAAADESKEGECDEDFPVREGS